MNAPRTWDIKPATNATLPRGTLPTAIYIPFPGSWLGAPNRQNHFHFWSLPLLLLCFLVISHAKVASASAVVALKMRYYIFLSSLVALVSAQKPFERLSARSPLVPDEDGKYTLQSEGIRAQFIPYGASLTNLFILDQHGMERDIVLGFDNASYYGLDTSHPHLGGVPGKPEENKKFRDGERLPCSNPLRTYPEFHTRPDELV
jgi:hypothetical protein